MRPRRIERDADTLARPHDDVALGLDNHLAGGRVEIDQRRTAKLLGQMK